MDCNTPIRYKRPLFRYGIWARIRGERTVPAICLQQHSACEAELSLRNSTNVSQIFKVLLSLRDLISRSSFFKSSCIRFARSDYRYNYICFVHRSGCWLLLVFCFYHRHHGLRYNFKGERLRIKQFSASPRTEFVWS